MELSLLNKLQGTLLWFNFYHITSHYFENAPSRIVYDVDTRNFHVFVISQKLLKGSVALFKPENKLFDFPLCTALSWETNHWSCGK